MTKKEKANAAASKKVEVPVTKKADVPAPISAKWPRERLTKFYLKFVLILKFLRLICLFIIFRSILGEYQYLVWIDSPCMLIHV